MVSTAVAIDASDQARDDEGAFLLWVRPHLTAMTRLAARIAEPADRDDAVQQALLRAWTYRKRFDPALGSARGWLLAITANEARRMRSRPRPFALLASIPAHLKPVDDRLDIEGALARLSRRQGLAIDCRYFVGLSVSETAEVMSCSEGTVKSTLADARARLRKLLGRRDG